MTAVHATSYKVEVTAKSGEKKIGYFHDFGDHAYANPLEAANDWIATNKANIIKGDECVWGKVERWVADIPSNNLTAEDKASALETRQVAVEDGVITEYKLPQDFTVSAVQDVTAEFAALEALRQAKKDITFGKNLIALFRVRSSMKNLTTEQSLAVITRLSSIKPLLESGSIAAAKNLILGLDEDELTTAEDKSYIIAKINAYLGIE